MLNIVPMNDNFIAKWESQVKKGVLEFIILIVLSRKELYGYELITELKSRTDYNVAEGTIYPILNRLKAEKLIQSHWQEMESGVPRKYYKITKEGTKLLQLMITSWDALATSIQRLKTK